MNSLAQTSLFTLSLGGGNGGGGGGAMTAGGAARARLLAVAAAARAAATAAVRERSQASSQLLPSPVALSRPQPKWRSASPPSGGEPAPQSCDATTQTEVTHEAVVLLEAEAALSSLGSSAGSGGRALSFASSSRLLASSSQHVLVASFQSGGGAASTAGRSNSACSHASFTSIRSFVEALEPAPMPTQPEQPPPQQGEERERPCSEAGGASEAATIAAADQADGSASGDAEADDKDATVAALSDGYYDPGPGFGGSTLGGSMLQATAALRASMQQPLVAASFAASHLDVSDVSLQATVAAEPGASGPVAAEPGASGPVAAEPGASGPLAAIVEAPAPLLPTQTQRRAALRDRLHAASPLRRASLELQPGREAEQDGDKDVPVPLEYSALPSELRAVYDREFRLSVREALAMARPLPLPQETAATGWRGAASLAAAGVLRVASRHPPLVATLDATRTRQRSGESGSAARAYSVRALAAARGRDAVADALLAGDV